MKKHLLMLAIASSCMIAGQASAMTKDEYNFDKENNESDYKVSKSKCDAMNDNAKVVFE